MGYSVVTYITYNLAQLKFGAEQIGEDEILNFIPKRYGMDTKGRISAVEVVRQSERER